MTMRERERRWLRTASRRPRQYAAAEAARDEVRIFVIFWDEYHIGQFADAIRGRKALEGIEAAYQIDLPLASIARGDFLVAAMAVRGDEQTRSLIPLRVVQ